jgi:hypothetical protein
MALVVIGNHNRPASDQTRPSLSPSDLRAAAGRVSTDLHMVLILSRKALAGDGLSPEVRAAVGEAFLLHVWSLREFFYGTEPKPDGVRAGDYFSSPAEWESLRPSLPRSLDQDWHRLVTPVSRLDPGASTSPGPRPYRGFTSDLRSVTQTFIRALPPERSTWFDFVS